MPEAVNRVNIYYMDFRDERPYSSLTKFWVKYLQKSVWLFVHVLNMDGSPSFGRTLFTRALHHILNE